MITNCTLCPRNCHVNRDIGEKGFCGASSKVKIARASLHYFEEPCISGTKGSGAVFFSHCTLKCVFCQNYDISTCNFGQEISIERLASIFLELQAKGALNINLVTPTHYVIQIIKALDIAKANGLKIPIIYNSSGYENIDTIKMLDGYIDVYLPDMKYFNDEYAIKYSRANNYFEKASLALMEMYRQTGPVKFNDDNIITKGIIVRHLMLPGLINDSKKIIKYLHDTYQDNIFISIMNQYTPLENVKKYPELNKKIENSEYEELIDYAINIGVVNGFIQEGGTCDASFIPKFDLEGVN